MFRFVVILVNQVKLNVNEKSFYVLDLISVDIYLFWVIFYSKQ